MDGKKYIHEIILHTFQKKREKYTVQKEVKDDINELAAIKVWYKS